MCYVTGYHPTTQMRSENFSFSTFLRNSKYIYFRQMLVSFGLAKGEVNRRQGLWEIQVKVPTVGQTPGSWLGSLPWRWGGGIFSVEIP